MRPPVVGPGVGFGFGFDSRRVRVPEFSGARSFTADSTLPKLAARSASALPPILCTSERCVWRAADSLLPPNIAACCDTRPAFAPSHSWIAAFLSRQLWLRSNLEMRAAILPAGRAAEPLC